MAVDNNFTFLNFFVHIKQFSKTMGHHILFYVENILQLTVLGKNVSPFSVSATELMELN